MKLEIMERRRKDPRYFLLKFVMKILTNDGKRGIVNNKEYTEFNERIRSKKRNYIDAIIRHLNLKELNYIQYGLIYDEMVEKHGYKGVRPVKKASKYITPTTPLYLTDDFLKDNEKVLSNSDSIKKSRSNVNSKKR